MREKLSDRQKRASKILEILKKQYGYVRVALRHTTPLELLVATILSAQCTDERVNIVTQGLFKKYRNIHDFANANLRGLEQDVRSTGFYRNKAKNIKAASRMIVERYHSQVPSTMEELLTLPGVARKTANIVLTNAFGIVEGIAVDTHVRRLSQRLSLTKNSNPDKIEKDLMDVFLRNEWANINYLLIEHGRKVCHAKGPLCEGCAVGKLCPSAFKF